MSSPKNDPFVGREILDGQFRVTQRIGAGGMGSVYRCEEPAMGREVAIKILHQRLKGRQDLVSRFRREARAMSQLSHPNTVRVFRYGELDDGSLYIVMEMLEGKNLNQTVRRGGPLPVEKAIPILIACCQALQEAHDMGIVHRDLKPENIFICNQAGLVDYPKVLDFGLAKVTEAQMRPGSLILTQEGMVFGTPEFMSPEQARGQTLDARSDIYSLACILYEALTGKLPFDATTPMEYVGKHVTAEPIPLNDRVPGMKFPEGLWKAIAKALAKQKDGRYQSATDFARALAPFAPAGYAAAAFVNAPPAHPATSSAPPTKRSDAPPQQNAFGSAHAMRQAPTITTLLGVAFACMVLGGVAAMLIMRLLD